MMLLPPLNKLISGGDEADEQEEGDDPGAEADEQRAPTLRRGDAGRLRHFGPGHEGARRLTLLLIGLTAAQGLGALRLLAARAFAGGQRLGQRVGGRAVLRPRTGV